MAHQDFSQICPIFKEGVEHEIVFAYNPSCTVTTAPQFTYAFGREVTIKEILGKMFTSDAVFLQSGSLSIGIYKQTRPSAAGSCSNIIGSIWWESASASVTGAFWVSASLPITGTTLNFTSTDVLQMCTLTAGAGDQGASEHRWQKIVVRFVDK